ncbi:ATP-dependent DNA helicase RecQ-like [Saccostrea cucullata]|uniref:ATP-dependent DNA helicase RecQ-like n=1 Tax=Saccostrea cuccullata TaxID=36930 RepID=UPI002ED1748C
MAEEVKRVFGIESFTDLQSETIKYLLGGQDVFLSIRTGGGKSLTYQAFPMFCQAEPCQVLIISPLLSIMKEQVSYLNSLGLCADYIHKECDRTSIETGKTTYVFTSPEAILTDDMWRSILIESTSFKLFVVDEAHMVINWGEGSGKDEPFREWFGRIGEVRSLISCPALVITATASRSSRRKLRKKLALVNYHDIVESPDRENIKLFVNKVKVNEKISFTFSWLISMVMDQAIDCPRHIIFCPSIKLCAEVYCAFKVCLNEYISYIEMFHSCTTDQVKEEIREDMDKEDGHIRVLIATSAAGMGVNYKNVNNVIHYGPPKDLDGFMQQLGRAGRDGTQSYELLFYSSRHLRKLDIDMLDYVKNIEMCRRKKLLESYNSVPSADLVKHLCCDVCDKQCDCNEENCKSFKHMYFIHKSEIDIESSSESSEDYSSDTSKNLSESESD